MIPHNCTRATSVRLSYGTNAVTRRICLVLAVTGAALAQDSGQQQKAPPPKKEEPAPLFGGKLGTRSSQKTKESATLGFNGIDPSGKVDQQMLAASPGSDHQAKVKKMTDMTPTPGDIDTFIKEGGLNKR
jgi:hypothetical protein